MLKATSSFRIFEILPTELAIQIVRTAARVFVGSDRKTAVNLAQTSGTIYKLVAPILYSTLIINLDRNGEGVYTLMDPRVAARVCPFVQYLVIEDWIESYQAEMFWQLFTQLEFLSGPSSTIERVFTWRPAPSLKYIQFWDNRLPQTTIPSTITHICLAAIQRGVLQDIVERAPQATRIAFEILTCDDDGREDLAEVLEDTIRGALEHPHITEISIRIAGARRIMHGSERVASWIEVLRRQRDPRVRVWHDRRDITGRDAELDAVFYDAYMQRSIWTEATSVAVLGS